MSKIKLIVLDQEMELEKARELYLELKELFENNPVYVPMPYIDPWQPHPIITYDKAPTITGNGTGWDIGGLNG